MPKTIRISARLLAQALDVPYYLFSDLLSVSGRLDESGVVTVDDPRAPALEGVCLRGDTLQVHHPDPVERLDAVLQDC